VEIKELFPVLVSFRNLSHMNHFMAETRISIEIERNKSELSIKK